jgi:cation/acetate symporter
LAYGSQLARIEALERQLMADPAEQEVREEFARRAWAYEARLVDVAQSLQTMRLELEEKIRVLKARGADFATIAQARRQLQALPQDPEQARELWRRAMQDNLERAKPLGGMSAHGQAFRGDPQGTPADARAYDDSRVNFLALAFCLMLGTAGLPHLLTRYHTTPNVAETRRSVAWSLFFIALLYLSAPALAVLVKYEVLHNLVGSSFEELPHWIAQWARLDPGLIEVSDVNGDAILQFGELRFGADLVMLATPELGGMPFVVSGLVAAGGLAAALSTADGLLLTISNALVHDMGVQRPFVPRSSEGRVILSKFALLAVAMVAAFVAALKPAEILALVSASFSLAAAIFFPAMVCGLFWARVDRHAAVAGMLAGLTVTVGYMVLNAPGLRHFWGWAPGTGLWWGVQPLSAGIFGVPAGFLVIGLVTAWRGWRSPKP